MEMEEVLAKRNLKNTLSSLTKLENKVFTVPERHENDSVFFKNVMQNSQARLLSIIKDIGQHKEPVFCSVARKFFSDMTNLIYYTANSHSEKFETGKVIGDELVENGTIDFFCKTMLASAKDLPALSEACRVSVDIMHELANYSEVLCRTFINYKGMLSHIRTSLKMWMGTDMSSAHSDTFIGVVHNCCMCCSDVISVVRESEIIQVLKEILVQEDLPDEHGMMVVAAIADVMDEDDSDSVLHSNQKWVRLFIDTLEKAVAQDSGDYNGWFSFECGRVLRQLSSFDANKKLLADLGALPALVKLAKTNAELSLFEAVTTLSQLAFDPDVQVAMLRDDQVIPLLLELAKTCTFDEVREIVRGTLWTMYNPLRQSSTYGQQVKAVFAKKTKGHIMISYSREQRQLLLDIRASLEKHKFAVWMDVDQMRGEVYDRMAEAVENAAVVILAMSRTYKLSEYCRREAAYAGKLNKQIIPLKVEQHYDPDGWLGIMTAGMFFYDFGSKSFQMIMGKLLPELENMAYKQGEIGSVNSSSALYIPNAPVAHTPDGVPVAPPMAIRLPPSTPASSVRHTESPGMRMSRKKFKGIDVNTFHEWLKSYGLPRDRFESLRPKDILYLARMKDEAPESYHSIGRKLFKNKADPLLKTRIMADLTEALDNLV